jgi:thiamine biosynthesis lipoprotein ApbE
MKEKLTQHETRSTFGVVRTCKLIGLHPTHQELRARNDARLAEIKKSGRLTEDRSQIKEIL